MNNNITQITGDIKGKVVFDVNSVTGLTNNETKAVRTKQEHTSTAKWVKYTLVALTITTILLSVSVCNYYLCNFRYDSDSAGVLISALAIIVTLLVAWQIWQTIDVKNTLTRMEASVKDAENRDNQLQHLLEAFQIDEIAKAQTTLGAQYAQSVNALRSFILAGVPASYIPITNIVSRLNGILGEVEQSKDALVKERFTRVGRECDNYYRDISRTIRERIEFYREVSNNLTAINDRRRKLTNLEA